MDQLSGTTVTQETTNWPPPCPFCGTWAVDWACDEVYDEEAGTLDRGGASMNEERDESDF